MQHAFAVDSGEEFGPEERELAERLARFLVRRRMASPALMALETARPVTFLGSQLLAFLSPFLSLVFLQEETTRFVRLLEKRKGVDLLVDELTRLENESNA